jgi:hypothetical protein
VTESVFCVVQLSVSCGMSKLFLHVGAGPLEKLTMVGSVGANGIGGCCTMIGGFTGGTVGFAAGLAGSTSATAGAIAAGADVVAGATVVAVA